MRKEIIKETTIPEGVHCSFASNTLTCKKGSDSISRRFILPQYASLEIKGNSISIICPKGNKKTNAVMGSIAAHVRNMFEGLDKNFTYELEICNVHFPMTVKAEKNELVISNFLGEKQKRTARILPHVNVEIKGQKITVSSKDIEAAGQTAANIEYATQISKRDRRVFQDGIFITSKPGESK